MSLWLAGCNVPTATYSPRPIPVGLSGGALSASATVDGVSTPFPIVLDTGTPLTTYDDGSPKARGRLGSFRLFSEEVVPAARLEIRDVQLFVAPLRSVGPGDNPFEIGGVLGGDNLGRFTVGLDYRGGPTVTFVPLVITCSCELADACHAVFPFTLQGGTEALVLGGNLYSYPPTRVIIDACLEPLADPVSRDIVCGSNDPEAPLADEYTPHGVDVRLLVSTGFPGFALGSGAYDRLRGPGAARMAIDGSDAVQLHLPDPRNDGEGATGLRVGSATLGASGVSALALVSREVFLGPCAELARSRRQRRVPPKANIPPGDPRNDERACLVSRERSKSNPIAQNCTADPPDACDDLSDRAPTAAVVEFTTPLPTFIIDDSSPLLQSINADARPITPDRQGSATIEGVIGTEVLRRVVSTVDYPNGRYIARCVADDDCITYPRYVRAQDCGRECTPPSALLNTPLPGGRCTPATPRL